MNMDAILSSVRELMKRDATGHGADHVERVYKLAMKIAEKEKADKEIVALAALLHDCDDYKLFGQEVADNLTNSKKIMKKHEVSDEKQSLALDIISTMGYSKSLKGIRPQTIEGKIVSDADMLEAIGVMGIIRCLTYALAKCQKNEKPIFDENIFPELNLSSEEYKMADRNSDNFINHFFEKLLKIKDMIFTQTAKEEAEIRHKFMVEFLCQFFRENDAEVWSEYLKKYVVNEIGKCA